MRALTTLAVAVLLALGLPVTGAAEPPPGTTVTLLTGDTVVLSPTEASPTTRHKGGSGSRSPSTTRTGTCTSCLPTRAG